MEKCQQKQLLGKFYQELVLKWKLFRQSKYGQNYHPSTFKTVKKLHTSTTYQLTYKLVPEDKCYSTFPIASNHLRFKVKKNCKGNSSANLQVISPAARIESNSLFHKCLSTAVLTVVKIQLHQWNKCPEQTDTRISSGIVLCLYLQCSKGVQN